MSVLGLTSAQANTLLEKHGQNVITQKESVSPFRLLVDQFTSPLILVLCVACAATFLIGDEVDAGVIALAIFVNTSLGFFQEYKAQNALKALSKVLSPNATVWRDGKIATLAVSQIVLGDMVFVEAGTQIPADGTWVEANRLVINEAILTGESRPVRKNVAKELSQAMAHPQDAEAQYHCYMGTTCLDGSGTFKVLATGKLTQVGKIAGELSSVKESLTPLQVKLKDFSQRLTWMVILLSVCVFAFGLFSQNTPLEMLKLAVAIAVSAIPEGLVISLTVILAIGMQRILKRKALVRKLVAAETLGSVTTICTDKTGTLTEGILSVFTVQSEHPKTMEIVACMLHSPTDPLEIALRDWCPAKVKSKPEEILDEVSFSADRRYSVKLTSEHVFLIGAPETVIKHCKIKKITELEKTIRAYAKNGYRIVAVAQRTPRKTETSLSVEQPSTFEWLGFFVLTDKVRKGVASAVTELQNAGLHIKVITGDHALTAQAVMQQAGISVRSDEIMSGHEFRTLSLSQLRQRIQHTILFARTTPDQKLIIVKTLQSQGEVVAMTGDGVNDALALKQADIGVVVSSASDVSKETADMVLLDDNFATIMAAVEEGRAIYENIKKVILYLLANSFAETIVILTSLIFQLPLPLTAAQILWVNLATDSLPSMALTIDPKRKKILEKNADMKIDQLVDKRMKLLIGIISAVIGGVISLSYLWLIQEYSIDQARTIVFSMLGMMSLSYVFSSRSLSIPLWKEGIFKNKLLLGAVLVGVLLQVAVVYFPPLQHIFLTVPLGGFEWLLVALACFVLVSVVESVKWVMNE